MGSDGALRVAGWDGCGCSLRALTAASRRKIASIAYLHSSLLRAGARRCCYPLFAVLITISCHLSTLRTQAGGGSWTSVTALLRKVFCSTNICACASRRLAASSTRRARAGSAAYDALLSVTGRRISPLSATWLCAARKRRQYLHLNLNLRRRAITPIGPQRRTCCTSRISRRTDVDGAHTACQRCFHL